MNCVLHLKPHRPLPRDAFRPPIPLPPKPPSTLSSLLSSTRPSAAIPGPKSKSPAPISIKTAKAEAAEPGGLSSWSVLAGASLSLAILVMGVEQAMALGPEGPLMEEFWDNVRRYALYVLTVSTGAIYTISQPIFDLLKNPITAVLVVIVFVGTFYLLSQILSAMIGISEFSYDYAY
ncbi:uncharacterized protein LOC121990473 [Zingiber officinale]|uniref:Uncharacterized protein ycf33 n=1 Tax=Zingiber officinale TaxID=94328 RepID=A0A8J5HSY4_ZINOF|nr:uncharacterized protein LOC121990473 [Zingiber officinale]KAG6533078.1 hypothetical protein ZIOFF_006939 [Zingiber officinale]